ncbi:MAG: bifunctional adenosylcobinamide kinase/adenosylcobinamide-phosphate guanylyltransferase [Blautia sp.]|nr:bifunctional adenosylcobinamide kinase/adenosylcobinamide-phosphate guanylyltransferase [Blautia sp.]MDY4000117.1 bifunctional adenosylcobinamide kinase/adenosylcobinamide-phosphate guanylyltransferase [Blautia sp.]
MEMIIGGAFQGKSSYAKEHYPGIVWASGDTLTEEELFASDAVLGFHEYIRKEMKAGKDVSSLAGKLIRENPNIILVTDEVGYGVVPVDAFDRAYREAVGRVCTELAAFSTRVTRVVCGIGTVIKDA